MVTWRDVLLDYYDAARESGDYSEFGANPNTVRKWCSGKGPETRIPKSLRTALEKEAVRQNLSFESESLTLGTRKQIEAWNNRHVSRTVNQKTGMPSNGLKVAEHNATEWYHGQTIDETAMDAMSEDLQSIGIGIYLDARPASHLHSWYRNLEDVLAELEDAADGGKLGPIPLSCFYIRQGNGGRWELWVDKDTDSKYK